MSTDESLAKLEKNDLIRIIRNLVFSNSEKGKTSCSLNYRIWNIILNDVPGETTIYDLESMFIDRILLLDRHVVDEENIIVEDHIYS